MGAGGRPREGRRAVVTGVGVVSPVGSGDESFWSGLASGKSGIGAITLFDASAFPVRIGGEVTDLDICALTEAFPAAAGEKDRKIFLGLAAAREAIEDAGLVAGDLETASLRAGVGLEAFFLDEATGLAALGHAGKPSVSMAAARSLQTPLDLLAELAGDAFGIYGGRYTNTSACAAGAQVIGEALRDIRGRRRDVVIAGGSDSMLNPLGLGGFSLLRVLSSENDTPERACRPFDATREGTVLGEGAAFVVVESLEHALGRNARIYAEVAGYGASMDAFRVSDPEPSGRGAVLAMRKALLDAGLFPGEVDCVNAHGTGTPKNDAVETAAIKEVLGERAYEIPVHAVKSMTGHLIAAAGAVEAAAAVLTLAKGAVPPTANLTRPDPQCDLDYTAEGLRAFDGRTVLSNSFGFGGQNAALVFRRYPR